MRVIFAEPKLPSRGAVFVMVSAGARPGPSAERLDRRSKGALVRAIRASRFDGKFGNSLTVMAPQGMTRATAVLLGVGKPKELDELKAQKLGAKIYRTAIDLRSAEAAVAVDALPEATIDEVTFAANLAYGARLRSYRFDRYRTKEAKDKKPSLKTLSLCVKGVSAARHAYRPMAKVAEAVDFTRDLVSEPGNVIYPESLAEACTKLAPLGVKVEILGVRQMTKLGMGALLGVGQGSARESRLVAMRWAGGPAKQNPIAFVGKGVTFDTGGISIKPAGGMAEMIWDMGGAGAVIGLMHAVAGRKAKANVVGIVGLVENMPSGTAQRPGDIVRSMSGQTIEVLNTDAEGRLVLADALWYTQDRFKPRAMVDLATLTGAIVVALGKEYAGLFASDDKLAEDLAAAGKAVGEQLWRMPLGEGYDRLLDGGPADVKNISSGRWAGSITAAQFLQRFTNKVPWAHLDIAGMAWADKGRDPIAAGATGFGVRLLDRFVADRYED